MDTFGELAFIEIDTNKENHNYQTINEQQHCFRLRATLNNHPKQDHK